MYSKQEDGLDYSTSITLNWLVRFHLVISKNNLNRQDRSASMSSLRKTITIINKSEMLLGKKLRKMMLLDNPTIAQHAVTHLKRPDGEPRSQPCKLASGNLQWQLSE